MTIAEKIHEEGKREGIKVGKREGIKAGKKEAMIEMIIKFLIKKFKRVPDSYKEEIRKLDIEELEVVHDKLVDIDQLSEIKEYLN